MKYRVTQSTGLLTVCLFIFAFTPTVQGQAIKILAGDALNGTLNGAVLGGATMALENSNDFDPLRVGVGSGILYGIGVGAYDISQVSKGEQFYISGMFNDGDNTTIIVLLDSFYGAAGGALIASAFQMITNNAIKDGLRVGTGVGAWAGFGFGVFDAFLLADRPGDFKSPDQSSSASAGLISVSSKEKRYHLNLVKPSVYNFKKVKSNDIKNTVAAGVDLVDLRIKF